MAHSALKCAFYANKNEKKWYHAWSREGQKKVVVRALDLKHIYELKHQADSLNLSTSLIIDAGLTELPPETVTCLGIGPGPEHIVDKITGVLKLL